MTYTKNLLHNRPALFLFFKNYLLAKAEILLIKFSETMLFLGNTNNADRNGLNEESTH